jgi:hypothetical protein
LFFQGHIGLSGMPDRGFRNDSAGRKQIIGVSGTIRVIGNASGYQERRIGISGTTFSGYREHYIGFSGTTLSTNPRKLNKDSSDCTSVTL